MTFGETIRTWRQEKGASLQEVADAIQIDKSYLSKIETSTEPPLAPSSSVLYALCRALGKPETCHSDELFRLCGRVPPDVVPVIVGSRYACDLIRMCEGLSDEQMKSLVRRAVTIGLPESQSGGW